MRMINPTAIATIRRLIDCLSIDPENFFKFLRVRIFEMSLAPAGEVRTAAAALIADRGQEPATG